MDLKKLKRATSLAKSLESANAEIAEITSMAQRIAEMENDISFDFNIKSPGQKPEANVSRSWPLHSMGFGRFGGLLMIDDLEGEEYKQKETEPKLANKKYNTKIKPSTALRILGILLCECERKRDAIIEKLSVIGVTTK